MQAHFLDLKHRAKQRGHEFSLTIGDYERFWISTGYHEKHGKTKESLSIERIDNSRGYTPDNITSITLSERKSVHYDQKVFYDGSIPRAPDHGGNADGA